MKKFYSAILITLIYVISLSTQTGCTDSSKITSTATGREPVKIRFAHWAASSAEVIDHIFEEYNQKNSDNLSVEIIKIPSDEVDDTIKLMFTSGQGPDIFGVDPSNIESNVQSGWIADLTPYVDASFLSRFPSYTVKSARNYARNGKLYTIASIGDTYRLIYNRDLFKRVGLNPDIPPKTLAEVRSYAKIISDTCKNENKYGFALPAAEDWTTFNLAMEYPATYSGLNIFDRKTGKYDLTVFKPWLQFFIDMKNDGSLFPGELFLKNDPAREQFAKGNIGMMFAGSWDPSVFDSQYPAECNWDVALPPAVDGNSIGTGALMMHQRWCWGVNPKAAHMAETVKVWKFLYSEEFLGELFRNGCVLPIIDGVKNNSKYQPKLKNFDKFFPLDMESAYPDTPNPVTEALRIQCYRNAFTGDKAVDESLIEGTQVLNTELGRAIKEGQLKKEDLIDPGFDLKNPMEQH